MHLLAAERRRLDLQSIQQLRAFLDGGEEAHKNRNLAYSIIQRDPFLNFRDGHMYDMSQMELREKTMVQIRRCLEIKQSLKDPLLWRALLVAMGEYSDSFGMRIGVHEILFKTSILFFANEEQQLRWLPAAESSNIIGSFAMTELGHSSSLRDIETTATLDKQNDSWILHSPTLTSTKWWMGMVGETATHTVLLAQTIVDGKNMGLNWFMVQLRSIDTGRLLPGISCGDLGAKAGRAGLDNGWIQFTHARIPRTDMMMKWCQVDSGGNMEGPPHPAITYATLIPERLTLTFAVRFSLGKALTIACRYGIGRCQGPQNQQILDYQIQQLKIFPALAGLITINLASRSVWAYWDRLQQASESSPEEYMIHLPDIHASSAGLKSSITWWATEVLENCRRLCGGHAYSAYNGIASLIADWGVMTTGGGDNYPMAQQCGRYIVSSVLNSQSGKSSNVGSALYLNNFSGIKKSIESFRSESMKLDASKISTFIQLFECLVLKLALRISDKVKILKSKGSSADPWNDTMSDLIVLSNLHSQIHILNRYKETMTKQVDSPCPAEIQTLLDTLATLYAADLFYREFRALSLELELVHPLFAGRVFDEIQKMCGVVRQNVVLLTDALGFPDFILMSAIGRYDGNMYEAYFDMVKKSDKSGGLGTKYFETEIKPLLGKI